MLKFFGLCTKLELEFAEKEKSKSKLELELAKEEKSNCEKRIAALEEEIKRINKAKICDEKKLNKKLETFRVALNEKDAEIAAINRQREWCAPDMLIFPNHPEGIFRNTFLSGKKLLKNESSPYFDLCFRERFNGPSRWAFYWLIAHASRSALFALNNHRNEDGISRTFLSALDNKIKQAGEFLEIAYSPIFEQVRPALKEEDVGADILLVVSGSGLCPNGGIKIFWIQAKRNYEGSPYELDFWREKNKHGFQLDTLRKQHQPTMGSAAFYVMYSTKLEYLPAISVEDMPKKAPETKAESKKDISDKGERLAEFLTAKILNDIDMGEFSTSAELISFLENMSNTAPVNIIIVHPNENEYKPELLMELSNYYKSTFGPKPDNKPFSIPKM